MAETYIKLFRKVVENDLFNEKPFDHWHAFEWLMIRACRFEKTEVIKGRAIHLKPGQLIIGQRKLAETFGWGRGKVARFCKLLEDLEMATFDSATYGASIGTVITIENYSRYQDEVEPDGATGNTTDEATGGATSRATDRANIKKDKKDKKYIMPAIGEFGNVYLTEEELEKLKEQFPYDWQDRIERLSGYIASKGKRYKSHYATILSWARKDKKDAEARNSSNKESYRTVEKDYSAAGSGFRT